MPAARLPFLCAVALPLLVCACAPRRPAPQLVAEVGKADALAQAGCYRCLEEALAIYERMAAAARPPAGVHERAFDTALLLIVRAKELGIPAAEGWAVKARSLADRLASAPNGRAPLVPPAALLAAAEYIPGELSGFDPEMRQQRVRRPALSSAGVLAPLPVRTDLQPAVPTSVTAQYLALALDCDDARARKEITAEAIAARFDNAPLIRFRLAMCGFGANYLDSLRPQDPRWTDTLFTEGRRFMTLRPMADVPKAVERFTAAHEAFPESNAITLALAQAQGALGEYAPALALYDSVLADLPTHRDAMLGRVMSLSYLNRHTEAVESASRMIELGTWHIGDAYYWRAWNRYHLYALDSAWDDVERSIKLLVNTSVYTLAGFIAYARKDLDVAIDRFDRAFAMDKTNCEAVWTAGLVHVDMKAWEPAAPKFAAARTCFTEAAAHARDEIVRIQAASFDEALKARRIAVEQKRVETSEHRASQAAFNAAQTYALRGEKAPALTYVDMAIEHPLMREKAAALKTAIEKMP